MKYMIYDPGGNKTALVFGNEMENKKYINEKILKLHKDVEQVGFLTSGKQQLIMAGGEFCGNATRCSAYYYLKGKQGEIDIKVSGTTKNIRAGIDDLGRVFSQIPHSFRRYCL